MHLVLFFCKSAADQSCKSAPAFPVGFGPKVDKNFGPNSCLRRAFFLGAQKYNQINLAKLLRFSYRTQHLDFFGHDLGFKLVFGFGPEIVGPFTILQQAHNSAVLAEKFLSLLAKKPFKSVALCFFSKSASTQIHSTDREAF